MEEIIIQFHQIDDQIEFPHLWEPIVMQFPHLGEPNQLEGRISESVEKFKNLLGSFLFILTVKDFHGSKPWIRAIKKHLKFNKDWKEVVRRSNVKTENC